LLSWIILLGVKEGYMMRGKGGRVDVAYD
jgi:hypothetical protein